MEPTEAAPEEKEAAQLPYCRQQVLLLLLILVAPVPAGDSRAIWRSQKPAALAAHSRHPLPAQHRCEHSALSFYTYFPPPASTATVGAATLTLGGKQERKHIGRQTKKKKRESKQEKKRNFVDVAAKATDGRRRNVAMRGVLASQAVQSVHHLLHVAAAQITKAIR